MVQEILGTRTMFSVKDQRCQFKDPSAPAAYYTLLGFVIRFMIKKGKWSQTGIQVTLYLQDRARS